MKTRMTRRFKDLQYIFLPKGFSEIYGYLGTSVNKESYYYKYLYPLVLALDHEAKPKWCPRWFLRLLHVFGNDRSIVRVRNRYLSNLKDRITKGIGFIDWKTKWADYDLRISISAPDHLQDLADAIEIYYYKKGKREELTGRINKLNPHLHIGYKTLDELEEILSILDPNIKIY
jgi:hypothetical protein